MKVLSEDELSLANTIICETPAGEYELREIYKDHWDAIGSPTTFGKRFKASVEAGMLQGIRVREARKSNNHHTYYIGRDI